MFTGFLRASSFTNWSFIFRVLQGIKLDHRHAVGLPRWFSGKESTCQCRRWGSIPRLGRSPGEGNGNLLQCLAWEMPWTQEPGGLQSMGLQKAGYDLAHACMAPITFIPAPPGIPTCIADCSGAGVCEVVAATMLRAKIDWTEPEFTIQVFLWKFQVLSRFHSSKIVTSDWFCHYSYCVAG